MAEANLSFRVNTADIGASFGRFIPGNRRYGGVAERVKQIKNPNPVVPQFESGDLFGIAVRSIAFEPRRSAKRTVAGEIRKRRHITTLNVRSFLHPKRIVLKVLTNLRPAPDEMPCLNLP
jgi:hypothetical protein